MARKAGVSINTRVYEKFKGVDFTTDPSMVESYRSPWAVNMISDKGGMPEKRAGWRKLLQIPGKRINGIYRAEFETVYVDKRGEMGSFKINAVKFWEKTGLSGDFVCEYVFNITSLSNHWEIRDADGTDIYDGSGIENYGIVCESYYHESEHETMGEWAYVEFTIEDGNPGEQFLIHAGNSIYKVNGGSQTPVLLKSSVNDEKSKFIYIKNNVYIFTGSEYLRFNGKTIDDSDDFAYVPTVVIASVPSGGGTKYEDVNLLTRKRKVSFRADGTSKEYYTPEHIESAVRVKVNGSVVTNWSYIYDQSEGGGIVVGYYLGVEFSTAPEAPSGQADNVEIEYVALSDGGKSKIEKCRQAIAWGINGAEDRIVCCGNPDTPNIDYISQFDDPTYFPDLNYFIVGTSETAIQGYARLGKQLAVIKNDNGQGSTVFIRDGGLDAQGNAVFTLFPAIAGVGALSTTSFGNIGDERLVLTGNGVYAITTNSLTAERIAQNRSYRVDTKLVKEENFAGAFVENYENMLCIFVNGHVYVLDGNQKSYSSRDTTDFVYECYYFEDVPARVAHKVTDNGTESMYFGTEDGYFCKFNTDIESMNRFSDGGDENADNGEPILAVWSTKADDDGDPMILKTLLKKGNAVTLKPYARSSAKLCIRTDRDTAEWQANDGTMDIFNWEDIDFSRFTFASNDGPQEIPVNRKVKNYKRLQFLIKNDSLNEGFGVYKITKHYVTGNFAKR